MLTFLSVYPKLVSLIETTRTFVSYDLNRSRGNPEKYQDNRPWSPGSNPGVPDYVARTKLSRVGITLLKIR